jgi:ligand-binding sensor domain-containing protein/two-component sensor histidine kinase
LGFAQSQHRIGDFMAYGPATGLPASFYFGVLQSADGYLWISSSSGLVRFDGKDYQTYFSDYADTNSLADNVIVGLAEDADQHLWIAGRHQGLSRMNLVSGHITRYAGFSKTGNSQQGIHNLLVDAAGDIWVGTAGRGLAHYLKNEDCFEYFIPAPDLPFNGTDARANHVTDIVADAKDPDLFWLSSFQGVYSFNTYTKEFKWFPFYYPAEKIPAPFLCIEADAGNKLWMGTWYYGMVSFDISTHAFETHIYPQADPPNSFHYLVLDIELRNDSTLYLATGNTGLLAFHLRDKSFHQLLTNDMLPTGSSAIDIQRISSTGDAGWFIGGNYFIYQEHPSFNRFSNSVSFPYGKHFSVYQTVYDDRRDGYWLACQNAREMIFWDRNMTARSLYQLEEPTSDDQFLDVAVDANHRVWALTNSLGLVVLDPGEKKFKTVKGIPLIDAMQNIENIEHTPTGNLWIATTTDLYYLQAVTNDIETYPLTSIDNAPLSAFTLCAGAKDDAWVSTSHGLFHCIRNKGVQQILPDNNQSWSIASSHIKAMTIDKAGNAWLGFESDGIQVVSGADHTVIASFNLDDGLPCMQINFMATDTNGGIWAGSAAGLAYYEPWADTPIWQLFNRQDGMRRDYVDQPITATADGRLFFNIEAGMSWIDIAESTAESKGPTFHLTAFDVDGLPYRDDMLPDYLTSVDLSHDVDEIRIEYAAMDFIHPDRTKYFYQLVRNNVAGEWIENKQASIILTGMRPGVYTLHMYAVNAVGEKSRQFTLPITIRPPFWYRWWFVSLCALALIEITYSIYQYRIRQWKKIQSMRNTISNNLHDDIGASLSNIHILTVLTQRNLPNQQSASSYITKAGDEIQRISESLSDIVWNISPKYDDLDNLFVRMKRYAADMLDGKNIEATLEFPEHPDKFTMSMDQRRDFYLIFKEAINNLVKYAEATEAGVHVAIAGKQISMVIIDNGKGFEQLRERGGNGLENMKERAAKWKSLLDIRSSAGAGTRIELTMHLN